ncbi:molybdopterin-guanine dinucleotide biosynthesis protein B [Bacillus sp. MUM 116]|uniref:molybdopterin-guanine dinucleotide biosynthesis protein B n=1 Tax=Bacillus sp. MUM 116 TaxID=1678002 RepID=UPI0009F68A8A
MALVRPNIFQVVGFQNSGKTTVILKIIEELTKQGVRTVTLKHHGHGGKPSVISQKDSARHISAGAAASLVEGGGRLLLQAEDYSMELDDQIKILEPFQPDYILIEGHKQKNYPKLLILREKADLSLLEIVKNVKMILYWNEEIKTILGKQEGILLLPIHDKTSISKIADFLIKNR